MSKSNAFDFVTAINECIKAGSSAELNALLAANPHFDEFLASHFETGILSLKGWFRTLVNSQRLDVFKCLDEHHSRLIHRGIFDRDAISTILGHDDVAMIEWMHERGLIFPFDDAGKDMPHLSRAIHSGASKCSGFLAAHGYPVDPDPSALALAVGENQVECARAIAATGANTHSAETDVGLLSLLAAAESSAVSKPELRQLFQILIASNPVIHELDSIARAGALGKDRVTAALSILKEVHSNTSRPSGVLLQSLPANRLPELVAKGYNAAEVMTFAARHSNATRKVVPAIFSAAQDRGRVDDRFLFAACECTSGARLALRAGFDLWKTNPVLGEPWLVSLINVRAEELEPQRLSKILQFLQQSGVPLSHPSTGESLADVAMTPPSNENIRVSRFISIDALIVAIKAAPPAVAGDPTSGRTVLHNVLAEAAVLLSDRQWAPRIREQQSAISGTLVPLLAAHGMTLDSEDLRGNKPFDLLLKTKNEEAIQFARQLVAEHSVTDVMTSRTAVARRGPRL